MMSNLEAMLEGVLTQPTAPFRESWPKKAIAAFCEERALPIHEDTTGNLWVNARSAAEARRASLVFVAHLDHPGVIITRFSQSRGRITARGQWLGGGPSDIKDFDVKVFSDVNALMVFDGTIKSHTSGPRGPKEVLIDVKPSPLARAACTPQGLKALGPWGACLWYRKHGVPTGVVKRDGQWVTKAADDLVGVCALIEGLARAGRPRGVVALLTRAEESGFHGAIEVLKRKTLDPKRTLMISIETSAQLPGGELGKGPVVRLGDRATVFDPALVYWVQGQATALAAQDKSFRFQRRVMDGGACEATAFNVYGFRVAGLSTPLKNYHNVGTGERPEPEAVGVIDVEQLTTLIARLMKSHRRSHAASLTRDAFALYAKSLLANQKTHEKYFDGF